ncbi:MAG: ABC transporter ATP-binding protein [archaeon]
MKTAIKIKNLTKGFEDNNQILPNWLVSKSRRKTFYAVKNVTFDVKEKEIFGILGPNGCGKSTVIRMMSTLLMPDSGSIQIFGIDPVKKPDEIKKIINRVSVEASFFKRLSAKENLLYAARLYGIDDSSATKKFTAILKELNFPEDKINDQMMKFSRGMQQKVSIARGFITDPTLILLDEPTTGLDPKSKLDVQLFIARVHRERDLTIIISSHDMEEIERICDRIAIMDRGKVIAIGTSDELKKLVMKEDLYEIDSSNSSKTKKIVENIKQIHNVHIESKKVRFTTKNISEIADKLTTELKKNNIKFKHLTKIVPSLEDVFLELTGKSLEGEE